MAEEPLRKRILSTSSFKNLISSVSSSGATTPTKPMEKTDSLVNLTQSSLYGIFNNNSQNDLNKELDEPEAPTAPVTKQSDEPTPEVSSSYVVSVLRLLTKILIVGVGAFLYNEVTERIHSDLSNINKHSVEPIFFTKILLKDFITQMGPFKETDNEDLVVANEILALIIQGFVMSSITPMVDYLMPPVFKKRLLSSNPNPNSNQNLISDMIRLLITFLGISYAIRKIEWASTLQVSMTWSLLNPGLWLLLDGTMNGFLTNLFCVFCACAAIYSRNGDVIGLIRARDFENFVATWLWIGSFFFCGMTLFGKLGRVLFGR